MEFELKIGLKPDQLSNIYGADSRVIIAKQSNDEESSVAWQVFKPLTYNKITWTEAYGIYASTAPLSHGAKLTQLANLGVRAERNKLYRLVPGGVIVGPEIGGVEHAFALVNEYDPQPFMTVGLCQNANVNGAEILGNACSAAPVPLRSTAVMAPTTTISVWLQSNVEPNTVVTKVTSSISDFTFGNDTTRIFIEYDTELGCFYLTNR